MPKNFVPVKTDPVLMSAAELWPLLGGLKDSELMRSLIMAEVYQVRNGTEREDRTMRNVWYDNVKPVLSRLGMLNQKTKGGQAIDWPAKLSVYLAELVRAGETTYEELRIIDGSRQRQVSSAVDHTLASVPIVGAHYPWVILFTEKDTIWSVIESLASLYGVSAISGGGEPSLACTENTVQAILNHDAYTHGTPLILLSLTDYDPSGYTIANAQYEQLRDMAGVLGHSLEVEHTRLGLVPSQLTPEERDAKSYSPKDQGLAEWYAMTGGVDGQRLGLELDALPLSRLRAMFARAIQERVDMTKRAQDLRLALVELIAWEELRPLLDAKLDQANLAIWQAGLLDAIRLTDLPAELFTAAAVGGWDSINPLTTVYGGRPLFDCVPEVRATIRAAIIGEAIP